MGKKVEVIIQARMGSTRLPGKVMMDLFKRPVLWHILERIKQAKLVDEIVVATSVQKADDEIYDYLNSIGTKCFRGSETDVLARYYYAAKQYPADAIVRITADCPLIDPYIIDKVILGFLNSPCEYASNAGEERKYPRGLDCEIFTYSLLERAFNEASQDYEREHVTPFMYWKQDSILSIENDNNYADMRWTLDTIEDFQLIREIYRYFYEGNHNFHMEEIYTFLKKNPNIYELNHNVKQKKVR